VNTAQILACIAASHEALDSLGRQADKVAAACDLMVSTFRAGGKVLSCGNGGSAAEAMHMAEEAIGRYRGNRVSLPAVCLSADGTALTCIGNDFGLRRAAIHATFSSPLRRRRRGKCGRSPYSARPVDFSQARPTSK
jgi:phosphoheptose isomerase